MVGHRVAGAVFVGLALVSILLQEALLRRHNFGVTVATKAAVSAVIGFKHGKGLTVVPNEMAEVSWERLESDLFSIYAADADRLALHHLPGFALVLVVVSWVTGQLKLVHVVHLQVVAHAVLAILLAKELWARSPVTGFFSGLGWLFWFPYIRLNLRPDYDAWTSFVSVGVVLCCLAFRRTGKVGFLFLGGLLSGIGLWIRDYMFVLPVVVSVVILLSSRHRNSEFLSYVAPVVALGLLLNCFHKPGHGNAGPFTRGAFWHTFVTGLGQFENDLGLEPTDASVKQLAEKASGRTFPSFHYEFDPEYNHVLKSVAVDFVKRHPEAVFRNALYRLGWLIVPGSMPSYTLITSRSAKAVALIVSVVLTILAVIGFRYMARECWEDAVFVASPWIALLPLTGFYLVNKVPMIVGFVWIVFAAHAIAAWFEARRVESLGLLTHTSQS